jgi:hypothetical protein
MKNKPFRSGQASRWFAACPFSYIRWVFYHKMSKPASADLLKFLKPFPDEAQETVLKLRDFVWGLFPQANELIYDNYNALALGWSVTDRQGHTFCTIAVFRTNHNIHFGFFFGSKLSDPAGILLGEGKQYRYLLVRDWARFPDEAIRSLLEEAYANAVAKVKDPRQLRQGLIITKSISRVKRIRVKMTRDKKATSGKISRAVKRPAGRKN